jgi:hypothetical protein
MMSQRRQSRPYYFSICTNIDFTMTVSGTSRHVGVEKIILFCSTGTGMFKPATEDTGTQHSYTCWPKEIDHTDVASVHKWVKRTEKNDAYLQTVMMLSKRVEVMLKENNSQCLG